MADILLRAVVLVLLLPVGLLHVEVSAQEVGETLTKHGEIDEDLYLAGGSVKVLAKVTGDVTAAGGKVVIDNQVEGDIAAAGGSVRISAEVSDDVRVAGGEVTIDGMVADDAIVAGGSVSLGLGPDTRVGGRAWLAGGLVEMAAEVGKELKISAARVVISGKVGGNTRILAESLEILPGAVLEGDLVYSVRDDAVIDPQAIIRGKVTEVPFAEHRRWGAAQTVVSAIAIVVVVLFAMVLTTMVLFLLFKRYFEGTVTAMRQQPLQSIGLGLALLLLIPAAAGLLMFLLVGIPLAMILMAFYSLLLAIAFFVSIFFVSDRGLAWLKPMSMSSIAWRVISVAIAVTLLVIVSVIPFIGGIVLFLLFLCALGALGMKCYEAYAACGDTAQ